MNIQRSEWHWEATKKVIPGSTQTLSKGPDRFVQGVTPMFIKRAHGSYVWDMDDNKFIDYPCGLGTIILGHGCREVNEAIIDGLKDGNIYTLPAEREFQLASLLRDIIPCAEMVRFAKNGADATMGAVRIARAYTNRDHIAFCGYHGCHDWHAITGGLIRGIPKIMGQMIHRFEYNSPESLLHVLTKNKCAAVIMEQGLDEPRNNFLEVAKQLAHKEGALFILDEIVTGFRYNLQGAQGFYRIEPDIACFGKAMANGFSISAVVGRKEYMSVLEDGVFFSFTYGGELVGINAAIKTIEILQKEPVIPTLWSNGAMLFAMLKSMGDRYDLDMWVHGNPVRFIVKFMKDDGREEDLMAKSYFLQETVKRGILMGIPTFTTYAHSHDDIMRTIEVCDLVLSKMQKIKGDYEHHLEGKPIAPPIVRA